MKPYRTSLLFRILLTLAVLASSSLACGLLEDETTGYEDLENSQDEYFDDAFDGDEEASSQTSEDEPVAPPSTGETAVWTVLMYQDADDNVLEEDIFMDLNEAERIGSTGEVILIAQMDRYDGGFEGEDEVTGAVRYVLTQDDDLEVINSDEVEDLGEINMADGEELTAFLVWGMQNYPAEHYAVILSDHGTGWPGGWTDPEPENDPDETEIDGFDDMLYLPELQQALHNALDETGVDKFDLVGFDACLMGSLEVFAALEPVADYAVASQETEPSMGWAYASFLDALTSRPNMSGEELAELVVDTYIDQDTLIIDPEARATYLERVYDTDEDISPEELAAEENRTVTLTAVDLAQIPAVMQALDDLADAMSGINQKMVARARSRTQSFESVFGDDYPSPYLDLGHFAKLMKKESTSPKVADASDALRIAIDNAVIAEKHGEEKQGATGISIYFPDSDLFETEGSDYETYNRIASTFADASLWDDFLTTHYTGAELVQNSQPAPERIVAPGRTELSMQPLQTDTDGIVPGETATLSTLITGENIAYIYIFTGLWSDDGESIQIIDVDYLDSEVVLEEDGVFYPDWESEGEIEIEFDWEPLQYFIDDGSDYAAALLSPDTFGEGTADTLYTVDGIYHFASSEPDRFARLYFNADGELVQVMAFNDLSDTGPMRELTPDDGDQFTVLDQWIETGAEDEEMYYATSEGQTITFGDTPWTFVEDYGPSGEYVVGFIVEDMDGNQYEEYTSIWVE